ncbi:hypothetical protein [Thermobifida cellulosilytica]|uniref:hypothetical protein n=1 Tax=Thermobifida cellulosilytica TaxID=144786 RepID=UPI000AA8E957|nr:hypothetical protein [Thermobifida cellulosilytica]
MSSATRWFLAAAAAVAIVAGLALGLWLGGGPTQRTGWEAAGWAAGIICALALTTTAVAWAARRTHNSDTPPPTPAGDLIDQSNTRAGRDIIGKQGPAAPDPAGGDHIVQRGARAGRDVIGKQHNQPR